MTILIFPPKARQEAIQDFWRLRRDCRYSMPRHRRRAAALVGWKTLDRMEGETFQDFWKEVTEDYWS